MSNACPNGLKSDTVMAFATKTSLAVVTHPKGLYACLHAYAGAGIDAEAAIVILQMAVGACISIVQLLLT